MVVRHIVRWVTLGMALSLFLLPAFGQAQMVEEVKEKNRQLEAELQRLKAEYGKVLGLAGPAKKEILAMAAVLAAKPDIAFDFSGKSGEMCFSPGRGDMIHYAVDPTKTSEDVTFMLNAQPFIEHGLRVTELPTMPLETEKMKPSQWYYYDGDSGTVEPHHDRQWLRSLLIMSVDVYQIPKTQ